MTFFGFTYYEAKTLEDAETLRVLRNAGREGFSDTRSISREEQQAWWKQVKQLPPSDFRCMLACLLAGEPAVGYGLLLRRQGRLWVSLAVSKGARSRGLGTYIYQVLGASSEETVFAGILRDNVPSVMAAKKAGYVGDHEVSPPDVAVPRDWVTLRSKR